MKHLPLFFDLAGRKVVVVGEGAAADRRAELAQSAGAEVTKRSAASVAPADFHDAKVAFVATGSLEGDLAVQRLTKAAGVPVNVADRPALCDFILPAIVDRGDVVVAISTGGASPTLASVLRGRVEAALPERLDALIGLARTFRAQANALIVDSAHRRAFWRRLIEGPPACLALAGDDAGARRAALGELDAARRRMSAAGIGYIVGAGPGDPDLLTLRAAQLLQEADAIVHDALVSPAILGRARRDAEFVAVGEGSIGRARVDGTAELVRRVRAGQSVVRLKMGDALAGGEREALEMAGLPVAVVPGVVPHAVLESGQPQFAKVS